MGGGKGAIGFSRSPSDPLKITKSRIFYTLLQLLKLSQSIRHLLNLRFRLDLIKTAQHPFSFAGSQSFAFLNNLISQKCDNPCRVLLPIPLQKAPTPSHPAESIAPVECPTWPLTLPHSAWNRCNTMSHRGWVILIFDTRSLNLTESSCQVSRSGNDRN